MAEEVPHSVLARAFVRRLTSVPTRLRGDAAVLEAAAMTGAPVVTSDRNLALRVEAIGGTVLVPRDRTRLELRRGARREPTRARPRRPPRPNC